MTSVQQQQQKPGTHATTVAVPSPAQHINSNDSQDVVVAIQDRSGSQQQRGFGSKVKGLFKRNKKQPTYLTDKEAEILAKVKRRAKALDTAVDLGFAKIGLDPIIGLIPVAGDVVTTLMGLNVVRTAQQADIPDWLLRKMLLNVAIDFGLGFVPVVGDIGDFVFKANRRNARLFEEYLYERAAKRQEKREEQTKQEGKRDHHVVQIN